MRNLWSYSNASRLLRRATFRVPTNPTFGTSYRDTVEGISGLVAYWRLSSSSVVLDEVAGSPPPNPTHPQAYVYPYTSGDNTTVSTGPTLESAVNAAPAGRHVKLNANISGQTMTFSGSGSQGSPIVIRPVGSLLTQTMTDCTINITGNWLVLAGFSLPRCQIVVTGDNNRITRNDWSTIDKPCIILEDGCVGIRIDHNRARNVIGFANFIRWFNTNNGGPTNCLVDYNYCHDAPINPTNGTECFRYGMGGAGIKNALNMNTYLHKNLIQNWDSDDEVLTVKARGLVSEGNTVDCGGHATAPNNQCNWSMRTASAIFKSDWIGANMRWMRVLGEGGQAHGCRLNGGAELGVWAGDVLQTNIDNNNGGVVNGSYPASRNAVINGCVIASTRNISVGQSFGLPQGVPIDEPATNTLIAACTNGSGGALSVGAGITLVSGRETGTTVTGTASESFTAATQLVAGEVGTGSFDPYHNDSGPSW